MIFNSEPIKIAFDQIFKLFYIKLCRYFQLAYPLYLKMI